MTVRIGAYRHENGDAHIDLLVVEDGHAPPDDALFLELLDAPPARRGRQADFLGDIGDRKCRVLLQEAENFSVKAVHRENSRGIVSL